MDVLDDLEGLHNQPLNAKSEAHLAEIATRAQVGAWLLMGVQVFGLLWAGWNLFPILSGSDSSVIEVGVTSDAAAGIASGLERGVAVIFSVLGLVSVITLVYGWVVFIAFGKEVMSQVNGTSPISLEKAYGLLHKYLNLSLISYAPMIIVVLLSLYGLALPTIGV